MVYDSKTFEVLHDLTEAGKAEYSRLLELEADRILFRHEHPIRYFLWFLRELFSEKIPGPEK